MAARQFPAANSHGCTLQTRIGICRAFEGRGKCRGQNETTRDRMVGCRRQSADRFVQAVYYHDSEEILKPAFPQIGYQHHHHEPWLIGHKEIESCFCQSQRISGQRHDRRCWICCRGFQKANCWRSQAEGSGTRKGIGECDSLPRKDARAGFESWRWGRIHTLEFPHAMAIQSNQTCSIQVLIRFRAIRIRFPTSIRPELPYSANLAIPPTGKL